MVTRKATLIAVQPLQKTKCIKGDSQKVTEQAVVFACLTEEKEPG